jgi:hypothetical protein
MKGIFAMFPVRVILWTVAMAYTGFILTNQGLRTFNSLSVTEAFLGALTGFFLAIMFTLREKRRQRPALVAYSIAQIFPDWDPFHENRDSPPKPKR